MEIVVSLSPTVPQLFEAIDVCRRDLACSTALHGKKELKISSLSSLTAKALSLGMIKGCGTNDDWFRRSTDRYSEPGELRGS